MLSSIKQRMDRNEDEGFTLIELMVVLLIIAILLAIAIPTFLGARNTANARSTQENLRNALTAEQTNWTQNQTFAANVSSYEAALSYTTASIASSSQGGNLVNVTPMNWNGGTPSAASASTYDSVELVGNAKDGYCYAIFQSDNSAASFTAYSRWADTSGCQGTAANAPTSSTVTGSAANNTSAGSGNWYASF